MKITNAWDNRQMIINACKYADACKNELEFLNVLYKNFSFCVKNEIIECWLPNELPEGLIYLDCSDNNLK